MCLPAVISPLCLGLKSLSNRLDDSDGGRKLPLYEAVITPRPRANTRALLYLYVSLSSEKRQIHTRQIPWSRKLLVCTSARVLMCVVISPGVAENIVLCEEEVRADRHVDGAEI